MSVRDAYKDVTLTSEEEKLLRRVDAKMRLSKYHYHMGEKYLEQGVEMDAKLRQMIKERMNDA